MMVEAGQKVRLRGLLWQVEDVEELSNTYLLTVSGIDELNKGVKKKFIATLEDLEIISDGKLTFRIPVSPTHWKYFIDAVKYSLVHSNKFVVSILNSKIKLEKYQLLPLLKAKRLSRPRILIADDVGLGKTIEAGLLLMELIARNKASRILIVTPASLQDQWQDEMKDKFNLDFIIFDSKTIKEVEGQIQTGLNPWEVYDKIITSIDYVKRDDVFRRLENVTWDVVIVDEAHYLSYVHTKTDRARFGERIARRCKSLILLTATPHTGHAISFRRLLKLLEDRLVRRNGELAPDVSNYVVRRLKNQIKDESGKKKFEEPEINIVDVEFRQNLEKSIYERLVKYADSNYKKAVKAKNTQSVAFAMVVLKKRLLSSFYALKESLKHRIESLEAESYALDSGLKRSYAEGVSLTEKQVENVEKDLLRTSLARSVDELEVEKRYLRNLLKDVEKIVEIGDSKSWKILEMLKNKIREDEKVIIFTEYRDTQDYLFKFLSKHGFEGQIVTINGSMTQKERKDADEKFNSPYYRILIATDAASEGLNFQQNCSIIIHNELPWNPNRLEQRNGRVDRWGQNKKVRIYNLHLKDSYESDILAMLVRKLEEIRRDVGSVTDVLGLFDKERLIDDLMGKETKEEQDETQGKLDQYIGEILKFYNTQIRQEFLFMSEDSEEGEIEDAIRRTQLELPGFEDLRGLVEHMILNFGGKFEEVENGIFRIVVPRQLIRKGVEEIYEKATFSRDIATRPKNRDVVFLTPMHPLVKSVLSEYRRQIYLQQQDYRVTYKVIDGAEKGILFVFLIKFIDGFGRVVEERLEPVFVKLNDLEVGSKEEAWKLFNANSLPYNVPKELLKSNYESVWEAALEKARVVIEERAEEIINELRRYIGEIVEEEIADLRKYEETEVKELEKQKKRIQATLEGTEEDIRGIRLHNLRIQNMIDSLRKNVEMRIKELKKSMIIDVYRQNGVAGEPLGAAMIVPLEVVK